MESEFFQWGQLVIGGAGLLVSGVGLGCIVWGLFQMQAAGDRRNKEIDVLGKALERQGEVLAELLRRTA